MPNRPRERLKKHTIRLHSGDVAKLDSAYPTIGHNRIIRQLVRDFVQRLQAASATPEIELDPEDLND